MFRPFVGFLAFPLVAFSTLSISFHATLRYSNPHVSLPPPYSTVESHLQKQRTRSSVRIAMTPMCVVEFDEIGVKGDIADVGEFPDSDMQPMVYADLGGRIGRQGQSSPTQVLCSKD